MIYPNQISNILSALPLGKLVSDLKTDGFDPSGGELRFVGVESITVRRDDLC